MSGPVKAAAVGMLAVRRRWLEEAAVGAPTQRTLIGGTHGRLRQGYCGGEEGSDSKVVVTSGEGRNQSGMLLGV